MEPRFEGFSGSQETSLKADIKSAKSLALRCNNVLLIGFETKTNDLARGLLLDTFGIDGSNRVQVNAIRDRFIGFGPRIDNLTFTFASRNADNPNQMNHAAFVEVVGSTPRNNIFITPDYLEDVDALERSGLLIHEYIHLVNNTLGHPPGNRIFTLFSRARMNLNFRDAVNNAYCYQYFAEWLASGR